MKRRKPIPLPGQRIFRSALAVAVCLLIYVLRGHQGIPLYSALAAMQCMQPYTKDSRGVGKKRILGTIIGAFWGLLMLLLELRFWEVEEELHYILIPLMLVLVLYSTVLLKVPETAFLSGTVFLVITINHFTDANPYLFAFNRLLDTTIGVIVANVVNRLHLPRRKEKDTLFVSALGHSLLNSESRLTPYSLVELNRLMDDGMKFSLSTVETQATVRELLPGLSLRYPIITMDGAGLYDTKTLEYIKTTPMSEEAAERILRWLKERELAFFCNHIEQNLHIIRYQDLPNEGIRHRVESKRYSPYRNFVRSELDDAKNVVYLTVIDEKGRVEKAYEEFLKSPWAGEYRVTMTPSEVEGFLVMKIYDKTCSREAMLKELEKIMGTKKTVTFGGVPGKYDVFIENADRNILVKELKRRFEPVDFHYLREMYR